MLPRPSGPLLSLCLLILIDHMGFGILYPVLVPIFMDPDSGILGPAMSESTKNLWFSITLSVFPICVFFSAASAGDLSDQFGRKKILIFCLLIAAVGYALSAVAVDLRNLPLLLLSRVLAGLSAGSMPIAQAAAIDLSTEDSKASNLGIIILMASFGFLLGPLVGAFFTNPHIVSWFSYSTPLYFASFMALVNLWMLRFFKETFVPKQRAPLSVKRMFKLLTVPFCLENIRSLACIFLFMQLGWSFYFQFISIFLLKKHAFNAQHIGYFMSLIGVGFAFGSCVVLRIITKYFSDTTVALIALSFATLGGILTTSTLSSSGIWFIALLLGISMSVAYSIIVKLFSSLVSREKQGWIMGVSEAIASVAWATTPLIAGYVGQFSVSIPIMLATVLFLGSFLLLQFWKPSNIIFDVEEVSTV